MKLFTALLALATAAAVSVDAYSVGFDLEDHTSQLNRYHPAKPVLSAEQTKLPEECEVDQVYAIARHMTRYPSRGSYNGCMGLTAKIGDVIQKNGPPAAKELQFFVGWNFSETVPDSVSMPENLTALGAQEGQAFGKTLRTKYPKLYSDKTTVWSGSVERVQLTAKAFMEGYFGAGAAASGYKQLVTSNSKDFTLGGNTLTPIDTCPKFVKDGLADKPAADFRAKASPPFVARWQKLWPEANFTQDELFALMDVCIYERNLLGKERVCQLFTDEEWETYAYNKDIGYYYGSSYGNPLARTVGYPYVAAVARLLAEPTTPYCQSVFVGFSHDTQVNAMLSTLGVGYDKAFPSTRDRLYHSSRLVPMGTRLVTERIKCGGKRYVRVSVNEAVHPVLDCTSGPGLSCPLDEYVAKVAALEKELGDFATTCGVTSGAGSKFELFDKPLYSQCKPNAC